MKDLSEYLMQDEEIIWQANPNYKIWILNKVLIPTIILAPITLLILLGLINKMYFLITLIPFILFFDLSLLNQFYQLKSRKNYPTYYITSKGRIFIFSELGGLKSPLLPYEAEFSISNIISIVVKQNILEKLFGLDCKSINFNLGFQNKITTDLVQPKSENYTIPQLEYKTFTDTDLKQQTIAYSQGANMLKNTIRIN